MRNIYVITHAESVHHVERKVGGWYDTGLTEHGRWQAGRVADKLLEMIDKSNLIITTSDLLRAKETASIVAQTMGCECQSNPDLREKSYGVAEGRPQEWLAERIVPAPDSNRLNHRVIEGAETQAEFIVRIYRALDALTTNNNQNHIIVTHGYALTFIVARWIKMPSTSAGFVNFRSKAGGITHLQEDDIWRNRAVLQLNDTSHFS